MRFRPARKAPNATAVSAGTGGKTFSTAASAAIRPYSGPGGRDSRKWRRSVTVLCERGDGQHRDALTPSDPAHPLVGLGLDGDVRGAGQDRLRHPGLHRADVRCQGGPLGDDCHVGVHELEPCLHHFQERLIEEVNGVGVLPLRVVARKHAADVAEPGSAEEGVGHGVRDGVGVGVPFQCPVVRDLDAAEHELARLPLGTERMGVITDADAHRQAFLPRMRSARCAAFVALSIPTVATGTPGGTWTVASSASRPFSGPTANGTPMTGRSVSEAANPGSAAESPAPAITTLNPLARASLTSCAVWSGWRCAEDTWNAYETPALLSTSKAGSIRGLSDSEPTRIRTSGTSGGLLDDRIVLPPCLGGVARVGDEAAHLGEGHPPGRARGG